MSANSPAAEGRPYLQKGMNKTIKPRRLAKHNSKEMKPIVVSEGLLVCGGWLKTPFFLPTIQHHNVTFAPVKATTPWLQQALLGSSRGAGPVLKMVIKEIKAAAEKQDAEVAVQQKQDAELARAGLDIDDSDDDDDDDDDDGGDGKEDEEDDKN